MSLRFHLPLATLCLSLGLPLSAQSTGLFVDYLSGDLVQFPLNAPANRTTIGNYAKFVDGLDFGAGGALFALRNSGQLDLVDPSDASFTMIGSLTPVPGQIWTGLSFDSTTNTMFASSTTGNSASTLYTVDTTNGTSSVVGTTNVAGGILDIAVDANGNMFAHDIDTNSMYSIDKATGAATLIGPTGFVGTGPWHGLDFDEASGVLYMLAHNGISNDNNLRSVNLTTGATTDLGSILVATGSLAIELDTTGDCPAPATATVRNAGTNPVSLSMSTPVLGSTLTAAVDLAGTTGHNSALVVGYLTPLNLALSGGQTLLVNVLDPGAELFGFAIQAGPIANFSISIPSDMATCGLTVSAQAIHFGGVSPFALSNAVDLVVGS